ncbi:hypothetical protein VKT23_014195 [Stygiomarasmius scandens]|uniref:Uncharacterized protein n=1 Tax=Marasmiellus scandens TaxID=2682957 RepID=A0ABR1J244_9AGAR
MAVTLESSLPCMKAYIKDYVAIQYNAILENARMPDSDIYGGPWIGPPSSHFRPFSQAGAIQVLLSAINEDNDPAPSITSISPSNSPTTSNSTKSGSHHPSSHTGVIVGATVGAAIFLMLALGSAIYCFVHRQKQASNSPVTPFLSQNSFNVRSGSGIISKTDVKTSTHHMEAVTNPADEIDTPELIRVLNQRLHMEQHPGETPPPYHGPEGTV